MTSNSDKHMLSARFLRRGQSSFLFPENPHSHPASGMVQWTFKELVRGASGFPVFLQCKMSAFGIQVLGYGDSLLQIEAAKKSFSEAWERIWFRLAAQRLISLPSIFSLKTTNGFAAGSNSSDAVSRARSELIERATLLQSWKSERGWTPLINSAQRFTKANISADLINRFLHKRGWTTKLYRLGSIQNSITIAGISLQNDFGAVFDCATIECPIESKSNSNQKLTWKPQKLVLLSLVRAALVREQRPVPENWIFPEKGSPIDHAYFYSDPHNCEAFAFLANQNSAVDSDPLAEESTIVSQVLVGPTEFPAVAIAVNPSWPELLWGRESITGDNPWPHPLA